MRRKISSIVIMVMLVAFISSCKDTKTYAEQLEEENEVVKNYFENNSISVISLETFINNGKKTKSKKSGDKYDEYVEIFNGVYMQILSQGEAKDENKFVNGDNILVRYEETNMNTGALETFNTFIEKYAYDEAVYALPAEFRYVITNLGETKSGIFVTPSYLWSRTNRGLAVPYGWIATLPYLYDGASVNIIVKSKLGHASAIDSVTPYMYYIEKFEKRKN